jgi:hypothetical protein
VIVIGTLAALLAACAAGQDTTSRRIDSTPRILIGPPVAPPAHAGPASGPGVALDATPPSPKSDRDRRLDLELDLEERRDALREGQGHGPGMDYVAAIACVVGSGAVLVAVLLWASKRRGR